jgi:hypothetical protein
MRSLSVFQRISLIGMSKTFEGYMSEKQQILTKLSGVFSRWQELLASLGEDQFTNPLVPSPWTVKDVIAHLWTWQQISVVRLEAALYDQEPTFPDWWFMFGPDPEEDVLRTNTWIYDTNKDKPWSNVYSGWKEQFQHYLELTRQVPEKDLLELGRYAWMGKYALMDSCLGSFGHHEEHLDKLLAWLKDREKK